MISNTDNIILIGFMGSGKSRIGSMLAERLGYQLIDIDDIIEQKQGISIKEIFEQHGENYFRDLETEAIKNLSGIKRAVIIPGGGAPINFANAQILSNLGQTFFLDANFALIKKRLANSKKRPLADMSSPEKLAKLQDLFDFRCAIYKNLAYSIDVNSEDKDATINNIITRYEAFQKLASSKKIYINDRESPYPIFQQSGVLEKLGTIIAYLGLSSFRPVIITTDRLKHALKDNIKIIDKALARETQVITFGDGEHHKNWDSVNGLLQHMFSLGCTRQTLILALGGGNVGDVAGFAAGIYLRGIPFIQIPTTLLSMVDASIGGKTGIDNEFGKNLLGLFHNPKAVVSDSQLLQTLSPLDFACGMAEVIKHAIIGDRDLLNQLHTKQNLDETITRALMVKKEIVFADPKEENIRAYLNLGHTVAHALEKTSNYNIKHGQAVAIGLVIETQLAKNLGLLQEDFLPELKQLLQNFNLPTKLPQSLRADELIQAMKHDKKRDERGLKFVLPIRIGEVAMHYVADKDIKKCLGTSDEND